MNMVTFIRSLIISILVAVFAVMIYLRSFTAPLAIENLSLLITFSLSVLTGIMITLLTAKAAETEVTEVTGDSELGTVKWFNTRKGYGFITRDQGDDVFVHFRSIKGGSGRRAISEGQRVSFQVIDGDKGLQAEDVSPID